MSCVNISYAEFTIEDYFKFKGNVKKFDSYLSGLGRGVFWTNKVLELRGKKKLFCFPSNLRLDESIILSIIDQEIKNPKNPRGESSYPQDMSLELVTVMAFMYKFPCK